MTANILHCMVNHFMLELIESLIRFQRVSEDRGACNHVLAQLTLQGLFFVLSTTLVTTLPPRSRIPSTARKGDKFLGEVLQTILDGEYA